MLTLFHNFSLKCYLFRYVYIQESKEKDHSKEHKEKESKSKGKVREEKAEEKAKEENKEDVVHKKKKEKKEKKAREKVKGPVHITANGEPTPIMDDSEMDPKHPMWLEVSCFAQSC